MPSNQGIRLDASRPIRDGLKSLYTLILGILLVASPWETMSLHAAEDALGDELSGPLIEVPPVPGDIFGGDDILIQDPCGPVIEDPFLPPLPPMLQFDPAPNRAFDAPVIVHITSPRFPGAEIRYTLDNTDPDRDDPLVNPGEPIRLDGGTVILRARVWTDLCSTSATAVYPFQVLAPQFAPPAGVVSAGTSVSISCSTPDALISYALVSAEAISDQVAFCVNVLNPVACVSLLVTNWTPYVSPIPIQSNVAVVAKTEKPGYGSALDYKVYELPTLPRPDFMPPTGPITNGTRVSISSAVPGVTIRYTLDGSDPDDDSVTYDGPLTLVENTRLRARAFLDGYNPSPVRYTYYRGDSDGTVYRPNSGEWPHIRFNGVASAYRPVFITHAGDGTDRLFFVEEPGRIRIVGQAAPFLDITNRVAQGLGMISVAFPSQFETKERFYVSYHDHAGAISVSRFSASAENPNVADPNSERLILSIPNPYAARIGGQISFGRDGYLYVGIGAPDAPWDTSHKAQNLGLLLGKVLRIDVEGEEEPYGVPPSNPYVTNALARPEVWALGLRQPTRYSVDRLNGDLFIGDAGQGVGEVNQLPAGVGGLNLGWSLVEANTILHPEPEINLDEFTGPVVTHQGPGRIVGGVMYRGPDASRLNDTYFYGDERYGMVWGLRNVDGTWEKTHLASPTFPGFIIDFSGPLMYPFKITAFGEDEAGRLYVANYGTNMWFQGPPPNWVPYQLDFGGGIFRIEDDLLVFSLRSELDRKGLLRLKWQSAPGMKYWLQFSKDMVRWSNFHQEFQGTGAVLSVGNIPVSKTARFFFRVAVTPSD